MRFHKEGRFIIGATALVTTGIIGLIWIFLLPILPIVVLILLTVIVTGFLGLIIQFFRVPDRKIQGDDNGVLCPADGKIVVIERVFEPEFLKSECIQISIFMSPLNVHANYFPVGGKIIYKAYHPGSYLVAWHPKSSTENERTTMVIETPQQQKVLVRQIAGALARRICFYPENEMMVNRGDEFGFIKFGSRVDVFLPINAEIVVQIGDLVKNREDILAKLV